MDAAVAATLRLWRGGSATLTSCPSASLSLRDGSSVSANAGRVLLQAMRQAFARSAFLLWPQMISLYTLRIQDQKVDLSFFRGKKSEDAFTQHYGIYFGHSIAERGQV